MKNKGLVKRLFGMFAGAMVGVSSFGANLQTFAASAKPLSEVEDETKALEAGEYSISTPEELAKLARLVNNGHAKAKDLSFVLTTNLDLTEKGTYEHGYCDHAEFNEDGSFKNWKETGNGGGGVCTYRKFYQQIYSQV